MRQDMLRRAGLACAMMLIVSPFVAQADAQPPDAQTQVMARRAATVDAYRQLLERVKGLRLDSQTYVRDFVAQSDVIETELSDFIRGGRIADTRYYDDGTCEVDVEVTVEALERELKRIARERPAFGGWREESFERIHDYYTRETLVATGTSAIERPPTGYAPPPPAQAAPAPSGAAEAHPDWAGIPARDKLLARRAAQLDAYRLLAERVTGLRVNAQTYVRDFVAQSDVIDTEVNAFVKGAHVVRTSYVAGPICEVELEAALEDFEQQFRRIVREEHGDAHIDVHIDDYYDQKMITAVGMAVPGGGPVEHQVTRGPEGGPAWAGERIMATGYGLPPEDAATPQEARLLAERAAEVDAKRQLLERIGGVLVDAQTSVRDYAAAHDDVRAVVQGLVQGAHVTDTRYNDDGSVEVDVEAPLDGIWRAVEPYV